MKKTAWNQLGTNPTYDSFIKTWRQLRVPGLVKKLCIDGEQALKQQKVNGNWRDVRISA